MATHDPWDGTGWDTTSPDNLQVAGNIFKEAYDLRKGVGIRCGYEHTTFASSSAGGVHKNGAAVCYEGTDTPVNRPDGSTALANNAYDRGRLWINDNYDLPFLVRWTGSAFEAVAAHLVHATSCVLTLECLEDANTDGAMESILKFVGYKDAAGDCDLAWIRVSHDGTSDDQKGKVEVLVNDGDDDNTPSKVALTIQNDGTIDHANSVCVLDEDDMSSNSDSKLATQQSIKAHVASGTVTMTNKTLTSPVLNTGVSGTAIKDEDNLGSDSDTHLATQQSIKAYIDAQIAAITHSFGAWASKSDNTVYQAATDGLVVGARATTGNMYLYTDSSNPPTTERQADYQGGGSERSCLSCLVKKDDYWKTTGCASYVYWLPIGV
jgi:hypothetical protein